MSTPSSPSISRTPSRFGSLEDAASQASSQSGSPAGSQPGTVVSNGSVASHLSFKSDSQLMPSITESPASKEIERIRETCASARNRILILAALLAGLTVASAFFGFDVKHIDVPHFSAFEYLTVALGGLTVLSLMICIAVQHEKRKWKDFSSHHTKTVNLFQNKGEESARAQIKSDLWHKGRNISAGVGLAIVAIGLALFLIHSMNIGHMSTQELSFGLDGLGGGLVLGAIFAHRQKKQWEKVAEINANISHAEFAYHLTQIITKWENQDSDEVVYKLDTTGHPDYTLKGTSKLKITENNDIFTITNLNNNQTIEITNQDITNISQGNYNIPRHKLYEVLTG